MLAQQGTPAERKRGSWDKIQSFQLCRTKCRKVKAQTVFRTEKKKQISKQEAEIIAVASQEHRENRDDFL